MSIARYGPPLDMVFSGGKRWEQADLQRIGVRGVNVRIFFVHLDSVSISYLDRAEYRLHFSIKKDGDLRRCFGHRRPNPRVRAHGENMRP